MPLRRGALTVLLRVMVTRVDAIKIVLADDHEVVRNGLRMLLDAEDGFEVVAEAGDLEATRALRARPPPAACWCST